MTIYTWKQSLRGRGNLLLNAQITFPSTGSKWYLEMPQGIQPGLQMAWRTLLSCSHSNQRSAKTLPVPDSQGHLLWDLTFTGFSVRSDTVLKERRIICSEEKTPVDRSECWTVSALIQPLFHVARTPSVTDPLPVLSLDIPRVFLSYPVLYFNSGQNQTSSSGPLSPPVGLRKVILWCTMTEPLEKETQMWTRIPPK